MRLAVFRGTQHYLLDVPGVIEQGKWMRIQAGVQSNGNFYIKKNGRIVGQRNFGFVPPNVPRNSNLIGRSNWNDKPLDGVVLGLTFSGNVGAPIEDSPNNPLKARIGEDFTVEFQARIDDASQEKQKIFDFSNGPSVDAITFGQCGSSDLCLETYVGNEKYTLIAQGAVETGKLSNYKVGANAAGVYFIEKDGNILSSGKGPLPEPKERKHKLIGRSSKSTGQYFKGAILGLKITSLGETEDWSNKPAQINGAFEIDVWGRIDELKGGLAHQRYFDFGTGPYGDNILLAQHRETNSIIFTIYGPNDTVKSIVAEKALKPHDLNKFTVGVDHGGSMYMKIDDIEVKRGAGVIPRDVHRSKNLVGYSNWERNSNLEGTVFGLRVRNL